MSAVESKGDQPVRRRRWKKLAFILLINLLVLGVFDLLVGSIFRDRLIRREKCVPDPELGFRHPTDREQAVNFPEYPGGEFVMRWNSQGLRADETISVEKTPGLFRIVVVGDTHTEGALPASDAYPKTLERSVRERVTGPVEVINGGVGRYSPYQSYLLLRKELLAFDPDLVVVAVYLGNDLLDLLRRDDRPSLAISSEGVQTVHPGRWSLTRYPSSRGSAAVGSIRSTAKKLSTHWIEFASPTKSFSRSAADYPIRTTFFKRCEA